jgi:secondary thiamine-phosphate synthase enzyme
LIAPLTLQTRARQEFVDLTPALRQALRTHGFQDGLLLAFNPHTTAGLTVNEGADPDVRRDMLRTLERLVPEQGDYRHAEGNSDAHLKASLMGSSLLLPVARGDLQLGTWQSVYFCEFDGPRSRKVNLTFLPQGG